MACSGELTPQQKYPPPPENWYPPLQVLKYFNPNPSSQTFYSPLLRLEMAASAFFTHGYFLQAHVHISKAIINAAIIDF